MGCCLSAGNRRREAENRRSIDGEPPTSPRGILEVETVKEVLLETAVAPKAEEEKIKAMSPENQEWKSPAPAPADIAGDRGAPGKDGGETASEVTEVSEVCSCGESLSAAAEMERSAAAGADDGVVDQPPPRKRRAPGGGRGRGRGRGERVAARRVAPPPPPPEKRVPAAALRAAPPRNAAEENGDGRKVDVKEDPRARSRSPVGREEEVAAPPPPPPRKESDQKIPAGEAETLENPVVSLECFIFL